MVAPGAYLAQEPKQLFLFPMFYRRVVWARVPVNTPQNLDAFLCYAGLAAPCRAARVCHGGIDYPYVAGLATPVEVRSGVPLLQSPCLADHCPRCVASRGGYTFWWLTWTSYYIVPEDVVLADASGGMDQRWPAFMQTIVARARGLPASRAAYGSMAASSSRTMGGASP